jgi:hypothetical protein
MYPLLSLKKNWLLCIATTAIIPVRNWTELLDVDIRKVKEEEKAGEEEYATRDAGCRSWNDS